MLIPNDIVAVELRSFILDKVPILLPSPFAELKQTFFLLQFESVLGCTTRVIGLGLCNEFLIVLVFVDQKFNVSAYLEAFKFS